MNLKKYIENLEALISLHPETENYEVIYARDDEGNGFQKVAFDPSVGAANVEEYFIESFIPMDCEDYEGGANAVCIN